MGAEEQVLSAREERQSFADQVRPSEIKAPC